jgi:hypothetical protein
MSIQINIHIKNNNEIQLKNTLTIDLSKSILELKNMILKDYFNNTFNYLNLTNITERVYKDYGLLFFDKCRIPDSLDNYLLNKMTTPNRTFDFLVEPVNKEIKLPNMNQPSKINFFKKYNQEDKNEINKDYEYVEEDFPPLM